MLTPLNRAQLAAVFQQDRCQEIVRILDQHSIPSQVRTMDRTSPSVFSMGTRERSGALFQDPAQSWQYVIYVARKDLETARALTGLDGIQTYRSTYRRLRCCGTGKAYAKVCHYR